MGYCCDFLSAADLALLPAQEASTSRSGTRKPADRWGPGRGLTLRILILNWRCPRNPRAGGAEAVTHQVARRLVAQGHTVEWFSASFPGALAVEELDGIRI